jgi:RimJ/RimL family protein N-acetyltransferase
LELKPLQESDFENLYKVASDPLIWEQHPDTHRYKRELFRKYFESGLHSKGALLILDRSTGEILGSSRFYDHDAVNNQIAIGYTFLARKCWGKSYNKELKRMMIDYAFNQVENIVFVIGINNIRSRKAIEKTSATLDNQNESSVVYKLTKETWYKKP